MENLNELKPEDVMRALECCATEAKCDGCPFDGRPHCDTELIVCALALIREKDATIKDYKKLLDTAIEGVNHARDIVKQKDAEIERLKDEYEIKCETRFGKITIPKIRSLGEGAELIYKEIRAEAISEFANMVCEGRVSNDPVVIAVRCAEKEMKEEADVKSDL